MRPRWARSRCEGVGVRSRNAVQMDKHPRVKHALGSKLSQDWLLEQELLSAKQDRVTNSALELEEGRQSPTTSQLKLGQ